MRHGRPAGPLGECLDEAAAMLLFARRWLKDPMPSGGSEGAFVKPEGLEEMIDAYYEARGWTNDGLIPKKKLVALGLDDIAEDIGV